MQALEKIPGNKLKCPFVRILIYAIRLGRPLPDLWNPSHKSTHGPLDELHLQVC